MKVTIFRKARSQLKFLELRVLSESDWEFWKQRGIENVNFGIKISLDCEKERNIMDSTFSIGEELFVHSTRNSMKKNWAFKLLSQRLRLKNQKQECFRELGLKFQPCVLILQDLLLSNLKLQSLFHLHPSKFPKVTTFNSFNKGNF